MEMFAFKEKLKMYAEEKFFREKTFFFFNHNVEILKLQFIIVLK